MITFSPNYNTNSKEILNQIKIILNDYNSLTYKCVNWTWSLGADRRHWQILKNNKVLFQVKIDYDFSFWRWLFADTKILVLEKLNGISFPNNDIKFNKALYKQFMLVYKELKRRGRGRFIHYLDLPIDKRLETKKVIFDI